MSLALTAALAFSPAATLAHCSWDRPGVDPFIGNIPAAVDRYTDIPADVRARLKARMGQREYDEIATIRRDSITGTHRYGAEIRDMHFGQGRVCRTVTRSGWAPDTVERGLVYCEAEHCIIVPTVCRNVSRITRLPGGPVAGKGGAGAPGAAPPAAQQTAAADDELFFDPPGAGGRAAAAAVPALPEVVPFSGLGAGGGALPSVPDLPAFVSSGPVDGAAPAARAAGAAAGPPVVVPPFNPGSFGGSGFPLPPLIDTPVPGVPEPSTWLLWAAGLGGVAWVARRRRARMGPA
jgi:hypothetical protein